MAIRILVVDDDDFTRVFIRQILKKFPDIDIVGEAANAPEALRLATELQPDLITMDIRMPGMDGLEATRRILAQRKLPILMVSELTQEDSHHTVQALALGAVDFISKSSDHLPFDIPHLSKGLPSKIQYWAANYRPGARPRTTPAPDAGRLRPLSPANSVDLLVVGVSTGGPQVLPVILQGLRELPAPVVVAQQMPAILTQPMIQRLRDATGLDVVLGEHGRPLEKNKVYVIPGGTDAVFSRSSAGNITLDIGLRPECVVHPCANTLMESSIKVARHAVGVILSGISDNGAKGAQAMVQKGWPVLVQTPDSCVADEMPVAALSIGGASYLLDPEAMARQLASWTQNWKRHA